MTAYSQTSFRLSHPSVVDPEIVGGGVVEAERPKTARGWSVGRGYPSPHGAPEFFSILDLKMASFCAFWVQVGDASTTDILSIF